MAKLFELVGTETPSLKPRLNPWSSTATKAIDKNISKLVPCCCSLMGSQDVAVSFESVSLQMINTRVTQCLVRRFVSSSVRRSTADGTPIIVPELKPCSPSRTPAAARNSIWHIVHGVDASLHMPTAAWPNEAPFAIRTLNQIWHLLNYK